MYSQICYNWFCMYVFEFTFVENNRWWHNYMWEIYSLSSTFSSKIRIYVHLWFSLCFNICRGIHNFTWNISKDYRKPILPSLCLNKWLWSTEKRKLKHIFERNIDDEYFTITLWILTRIRIEIWIFDLFKIFNLPLIFDCIISYWRKSFLN